jgi:hypothetical protein
MASQSTPEQVDVEDWFRVQAAMRLSGATAGYQGQLDQSFQDAIAQKYSVSETQECRFDQVIELADVLVGEGLDLRGHEAAWLGGEDLTRKRVLEYAPGAGWISAFIAGHARELITFDHAHGLPVSIAKASSENPVGMQLLADQMVLQTRNGWWYTRGKVGFAAKSVYGDLEEPPFDLGGFDIAFLARVLPTSPNPYRLLAGAARLANTIILTERLASDEPAETDAGRPTIGIFRPIQDVSGFRYWWHLTPSTVSAMLKELGFVEQKMTRHMPERGAREPFYTICARRTPDSAAAAGDAA